METLVGRRVHLWTLPSELAAVWGTLVSRTSGAQVPFAFVVDPRGGSATIEVTGERAVLSGGVGGRILAQINELERLHPEVRTLEFGEVPGGTVSDKVIEAGRRIREFGWATSIRQGGYVASAGVMLFAAGVQRSVHTTARVGVHSWQDEQRPSDRAVNVPDDDERHVQPRAYFVEMLQEGAEFYRFFNDAAPFDKMHWMSRDELERFGLIDVPPGHSRSEP